MKVRFLALLMALGFTISCSEESPCDSYFLDRTSDCAVLYNDDKLVSEYLLKGDTIFKLRYNTNKKLEWLLTSVYSRYYAYDAQNRVKYILNIFDWTESDSLAFEYSNDDDLASAVNCYRAGNLIRREEYRWDGKNPAQVDLHLYQHNVRYSIAFEYDNNPKPAEHNFFPIKFEFPDTSFGVNNLTKETLYEYGDNKPLQVQEYKYHYNEARLPIRIEWNTYNFLNYWYRCSPRVRS